MADSAAGPLTQVTLVTAPDMRCAKELAEGLVESKVAVCVNLVRDVASVYRWEGKVTWDDEVLLVIKAPACNADSIVSYVLAHHPYENPEVIHVPITGGSPDYLSWLTS